jgi:hypothetical protein
LEYGKLSDFQIKMVGERDIYMNSVVLEINMNRFGKFSVSVFIVLFPSPSQITRVYPKVSGLAPWSENSKWYSSLPLGAIVLLFCEPF